MDLSRSCSENLRLPQLSSGSFSTRHIASVNGRASVESTKILAAFAGYLALTSFSCLHRLHWLRLSLMTGSEGLPHCRAFFEQTAWPIALSPHFQTIADASGRRDK